MKKLNLNPQVFQEAQGGDFSLQDIIAGLLNMLALAERSVFLKEHPSDKANGFYTRKLASGSMNLEISIPRTRKGGFRPFFLPEKWSRHSPQDFSALVESMLISSKSIESARRGLMELGLPVSEEYLKAVVDEFIELLEVTNSSPISPDMFAVLMDAKWVKVKVKGSVREYTVYTAIGISFDGKKEVLACIHYEGRESLEHWRDFLRKLVSRGLRRVSIVVHDDFSGLAGMTKSFFPRADVQLCTVHMLRNASKHLCKDSFRRFKMVFRSIKSADEKLASDLFEDLVEIAKEAPDFAERLERNREHLLAFVKYPQEIRSVVSSTNVVESYNRKIEDARLMSGGYFNSEENLKMRLGMVIRELMVGKWRRPNWTIRSVSHLLWDIFRNKFENEGKEG